MDSAPDNSPFPNTRWTMILRARDAGDTASARRAIGELCTDYWYPLYAFARRLGHRVHDAQDLTQGFFAHIVTKNLFASADPELGRLRTFLLTAFVRYIGDVTKREQALKRGGGGEVFALDAVSGEERYAGELADRTTPEQLYERSWAYTVLDTALRQLATDEAAAGRAAQFQALESFLSPAGGGDESYAEAATRLGVSEGAARQAVSRLRKQFRAVLRRQIADTLRDPSETQVDAELDSLSAALRV